MVAPTPNDASAPLARARQPAGRKVLVVDDDIDLTESLADVLRGMGHDVATALDAASALEAGRTFQPEVVFLDIGMPGVDGYEAARRIRGEDWGRACALVALSGFTGASDRARSFAAGFDDHLPKPPEMARLRQAVAGAPPLRPTAA